MRNGIRGRTFCFIASGMLAMSLVFTFLFYGYFYNVFRTRMEQDQRRTVESMADRIGTVVTNIRQNAFYLCSNDTMAEALVNKSGMSAIKQRDQLSTTFSINTGAPNTPLMQSAYAMLLIDPQFPLSRVIQGAFDINGGMTRQRVYSALDVADEAWYQQTTALQGQIYAFHAEHDHQNVFFSQFLRSSRIADPRYNENIGVVLYAVPESRLTSIMRAARMTDGAVSLLTFAGEPFLTTDEARFPAEDASWARELPALLGREGTVTQLKWNGGSYLASGVVFQGDWQCVLLVPEADVYGYIKVPMSMMAAVAVVLVLISTILSLLLSRQLTRPIIRLSGAMAQARDGHYLPSPMPAPATHDEIATLYSCYNSMTEHIRLLMRQTAEEAEKLRVAELKALQAQINPHFIYNTLDSVSCSALMEGNDDIVTMVTSLISILKYSVNFSRTTVPLREEIDYLQHYIRIQELRYKKGFRFACDVPESYMDVPVSQIILQPLVENALFHAWCPDKELEIRLFCEEKDGWLRIHVTDNGSGGDAEALNRLLMGGGQEASDSHGIGIRNVNDRIRLLLGGDSGLHYAPREGGGLDAVIQIPLKSQ